MTIIIGALLVLGGLYFTLHGYLYGVKGAVSGARWFDFVLIVLGGIIVMGAKALPRNERETQARIREMFLIGLFILGSLVVLAVAASLAPGR